MKHIIFILSLLPLFIFSQTGPGGIGNSDGSNGEPEIKLWLLPDSLGLSAGNDVSTWTDYSGNSNDLYQTNSSFTPIYRTGLNGHSYLEFSKTNNRIIRNPFSMPQDAVTVFMVLKTTDNNDGLLSYNTSSSDNHYLFFDSANRRTYVNGVNYTHGGSYNNGAWRIYSHQWRNSDGRLLMYADGTLLASGNYGSGTNLQSGGCLAIAGEQDAVDGGYATNQAFQGDIAELIMFGSDINQAERTIIENYLAQKYGLDANLASDKYIPADNNYNADVTGIGTESDGSKSNSSCKGLVLSQNGGFVDGDYVMCAHNASVVNSVTTASEYTQGAIEEAWSKTWYIDKSTSSGNVKIAFDLSDGINGDYPANVSNYRLLYRAGTSGNFSEVTISSTGVQNGDQIYFAVDNANLADGYYTLGTIDATNSPVTGVTGRTWYTLVSGDWDDPQIWTLDPSGFLPNNPDNYTPTTSPTSNADKVVILSGKTVTVNTNNKNNASLEVLGEIDFKTTTSHSFGEILGSGRILLAADNFPSGDASHFYTAGEGEGTVRYYGGSYTLNRALEFYNLEIVLDNSSNTLTLTKDYTINGNFTIHTGEFKINNNSSTTNLNITVKGDVNVESNGKILVGTANARHQFNFYGNFTNNGTVKFTNRTAVNYTAEATDGIVDANFLSDNYNQEVLCNGLTNFYRIEIDKGTDMTYEVSIQATNTANFNLFGPANYAHGSTAQLTSNNNALGLIRGTVRIKDNVIIQHLNRTGNYNISEAARLWVDGGSVSCSVSNAIVVYGVAKVSAGKLEALVPQGFTLRNNGIVEVTGGTLNTHQIRTSVLGAGMVGSYIQTGGTANLLGINSNTDYYVFNLTFPENVFHMSGGTLHIHQSRGKGGIFINSDPSNVSVTGGTVIAEINNTNDFIITSRAPFWNFILRNTNNNNKYHRLNAGTGVGSTNENLDPQPLVVLNNLTIEDNCFLYHNGQDITVGKDLHISANSQRHGNNYGLLYDSSLPNTLTFNGSSDGEFYIGHNVDDSYELYLSNLFINKTNNSEIVIKGDPNKDPTLTSLSAEWHNRLVQVKDTIDVKNGILNQGNQSIRLYAEVYVRSNGVLGVYNPSTPITAYIMLKDDVSGDTDIHTEDGAQMGNFKLNPGNGKVVSISSNVYIKRIGYFNGSMNIKTYNLKLDYLHKNSTTTLYSGGSTSKMIFSDANHSDGGLSLLINDNTTYTFPLGTKTSSDRFTKAEVTISGLAANDSGYVQINVVDGILQTTKLDCTASNDEILSYYWRVRYSNFTNPPTVKYKFYYDDSDLDGGDESQFVAGKVLASGTYQRSYEGSVNTSSNKITFDGTGSGFPLELANYTAGRACRFTGAPTVYYTRLSDGSSWYNRYWEDGNNWSTVPHDGATNNDARPPAGTWPKAGDIAVIGYGGYNGSGTIRHSININDGSSINVAEIKFDNPYNNSNRLVLYRNCNLTFSNISGTGGTFMQRINTGDTQNISGDFGEFYSKSTFTYSYYLNQNGTYNITPPTTTFPNLRVEGYSNRTAIFNKDFTVNWDFTIDGNSRVLTNDGTEGDIIVKGTLKIGGWQGGQFRFNSTGNPRTVEVGSIWLRNTYNTQDYSIKVLNTTPSNLIHTLIVNENILQECDNGGIDLFSDNSGGNNVILKLQGSGSHNFTQINSGDTPELYRIIMDKGTSQADTFTFNNNFTLNGPTSGVGVAKALEMKNGTLVLDDANIDIFVNTGNDDFVIPASSGIELKQGKLKVKGDDTGILLDGKLKISGGTVDMDDIANNGNNYIEYSSSGNAVLEIVSGSLTVGSQIRRGLGSTSGILKYNQYGGTVIIGKNNSPEGNRGVLEILNPGSSFNFTGGTLSISNTQSNPTVASLYLDPTNSNISNTATIHLGDTYTDLNQDFGIYSTTALPRLVIDNSSSNNPKATIWTVPLTINDELDINANAEFDANGLNLILNGDLTCNGTFTHNQNTTYFRGSVNQQIVGSPVFYNFTKDINTNTLTLNDDITVENEFKLLTGTLDDNDNTVFVQGDVINNGTHIWGGTSEGVKLNSTTNNQVLRATGIFGKLTIDNPYGIDVPNDNLYEITINNELKMMNGVFNIDKNLLILNVNAEIIEANSFGDNNMIQTNASFTDAGVKKYFPAISSSRTYIFPIGSEGKYTPIDMNITNISAGGNIRIKAANERQSTIVDDSDECCEFNDLLNVLQYHYLLEATNVSNFSADITMHYKNSDALHINSCGYDESHYIAARLLTYGDNTWIKPLDYTTVDEVNDEIYFNFSNASSNYISGEYTAGIEQSSGCNGAIPQRVPEYLSAADGDWEVATNWYRLDGLGIPITPAGTDVPASGPYGAIVHIEHVITTTTNYTQSYKTEIKANGVLKVNNTFGHRAGIVYGTGTLYSERAALPAGIYDDFFSSSGGTVEYGGNGNYTILPGINEVNNLTFSGTGTRKFPNSNIVLNGNLTINGAKIIQENTKTVSIKGNITKTGGSFEFANLNTNNTIEITGSGNQTISGDFSSGNNSLSKLTINKPSGTFTTLNDVNVYRKLTLSNGIVNSSSTAMLKLGINATVTGGSDNSHINGQIYKDMLGNVDFLFPVGKLGKYRPIGVVDLTTRTQFIAEYFHNDQNNSNVVSPLTDVSPNNRWILNDVNNRHPNADVKLYWGPETGVVNVTDLRVAILNASNQWESRGGESFYGTTSNGNLTSSIQSSFSTHQFTIGTEGVNPLPVNILTFNAIKENEAVKIYWTTTSETNCKEFIVERSSDGVLFDEIERVTGAGNNNIVLNYITFDYNPIKGLSYYRLKQVDFDGKTETFKMVAVYFDDDKGNEGETVNGKINVYPNPLSSEKLNVDIIGFSPDEELLLSVFDVSGRIIYVSTTNQQKTNIEDELNSIFNSLEPGCYYITLASKNKKASVKLIKTH